MAEMFYDDDADLSLIQGKNVAVLGYGSQGHAHSLSLRDSGVDVRVGLPEGSKSRAKAEAEGLRVLTPAEAVEEADVIVILAPDHVQRKLYTESVEPNLTAGRHPRLRPRLQHPLRLHHAARRASTCSWSRPRAPATSCAASTSTAAACRSWSPSRRTRPARPGTSRCPTPRRSAACAPAASRPPSPRRPRPTCSASRPCSAAAPASWCSTASRCSTEAGYQPEVAYFECLHELKLIVDLMYEGGIAKQRWSVSDTAEYGDYVSGPRVIDAAGEGEHAGRPRGHQERLLRPAVHRRPGRRRAGVQGAARQGRAAPDRGHRPRAAQADGLGEVARHRLRRGHRHPAESPVTDARRQEHRRRASALPQPCASTSGPTWSVRGATSASGGSRRPSPEFEHADDVEVVWHSFQLDPGAPRESERVRARDARPQVRRRARGRARRWSTGPRPSPPRRA